MQLRVLGWEGLMADCPTSELWLGRMGKRFSMSRAITGWVRFTPLGPESPWVLGSLPCILTVSSTILQHFQ